MRNILSVLLINGVVSPSASAQNQKEVLVEGSALRRQ